MIVTVLRNNLKYRENKAYVKWRAENKEGNNENHHLTGSFMGGKKHCDLLLAEILPEFHEKVTYKKHKITEIDEYKMLINCLEGLFNYVEHLQNECEQLNATNN